MLNNWLRPVSARIVKELDSLSDDRFGKHILPFKDEVPDLKKAKIAIIGIDAVEADRIRSMLYGLSFPFQKMTIADLGNIRKKDPSFLIPVLEELVSSNIIPVIIGKSVEYLTAQFHAYQTQNQLVNLVCVDEEIDYDLNGLSLSLNKIIDKKDTHLFNLSHVGYQSHFVAPDVVNCLFEKNYDCVRLGKAKSSMDQLEPVIRDADLFSFNLSSLKQSDAPGVANGSPNGFFAEEACQISRYAGMSEKLSSFGVYGFDSKYDRDNQTSQLVAQMIWYFLDGFSSRKNDFPVSTKSLVEYIVESKMNDLQIRFWKSSKSGRWWLQVPAKTKRKHNRHRLIPCSYNDYLAACQEDIPDRLVNAIKRFV